MTNFEKFEKALEAEYDDIYDFMEDVEDGNILWGGKIEIDERDDISDSYDWQDDLLNRVIYFSEFDIYIQFEGREASFAGLEWDDYKEVKPTSKTIKTYE